MLEGGSRTQLSGQQAYFSARGQVFVPADCGLHPLGYLKDPPQPLTKPEALGCFITGQQIGLKVGASDGSEGRRALWSKFCSDTVTCRLLTSSPSKIMHIAVYNSYMG